jgi:hypothetical protein
MISALNISVATLTVLRSLSPAPFLSLPVRHPFLSLTQRRCHFTHFFNSVIRTFSANSLFLTDSHFSHILHSAVRTSSDYAWSHQEFIQFHAMLNLGKVNILKCTFMMCVSDAGGAISSHTSDIVIRQTIFKHNHARIGGAVHHLFSKSFSYFGNTFLLNRADYNGAGSLDVADGVQTSVFETTNLTLNLARLWSGGWRVDRVGGQVTDSVFDSNSGSVNGAFFDFSWKPAHRSITYCVFKNNSAQARGGAFCAFHLQHNSKWEKIAFVANRCAEGPKSISIESVDTTIWLEDVYFDGKEEEELGMRFGESEFVSLENNRFAVAQADMDARLGRFRARLANALK